MCSINENGGLTLKDRPHDVEFLPVIPAQQFLWHSTSFIMGTNPSRPTLVTQLNAGMIGDKNETSPTYLKTDDLLDSDICGGRGDGKFRVDFKINVDELVKLRTIFYDYEGFFGDDPSMGHIEYQKTFLVFGGIPKSAIEKIVIKKIN